ncbi:MAG: glycosyltransferase family 4 protein, partial [Pseudohongiella sp.]
IHTLDWTARFVGGDHFDPAWASGLKEQCANLNLSERICFAGSLDDLSAEYTSADLFVLPSRFEGYGMVFAEALAFGLPIVAAQAGAVPDVVPASAGVLVPPDDVDALAIALQGILSRPAQFKALQQGARTAAAGLPGWHDTGDKVIQLLQTVATHTQYKNHEAYP